jgi:probable rRNA maturation factor
VNIIYETKSVLPQVPFEAIKNEILGPGYELNLVIVSHDRIKKLNTIYRDKESATDILSFPLSENEGEIYICTEEAEKERHKFDQTFENFIPFLFIHGCVHLKGYDHSSRMEAIESEYRKKFGIKN